MKRLIVSPDAEADLRGIWIYTFETWDEAQADTYLNELNARMIGLVTGATVVPRKRRPTKPTRGSVERRLEGKKRRGVVKSLRGRVAD